MSLKSASLRPASPAGKSISAHHRLAPVVIKRTGIASHVGSQMIGPWLDSAIHRQVPRLTAFLAGILAAPAAEFLVHPSVLRNKRLSALLAC